jgi:flagellar L-ring protein precursor FlgH
MISLNKTAEASFFCKSMPVAALFILFLLSVAEPAGAQSLAANSIFSDYKARRAGDVVTIHIIEFASGSNAASTSTGKKTSAGADGQGSGALQFIPLFGFDTSNEVKFEGDGQTTRRGTLTAKMSAVIKAVDKNGNLQIEGTREVEVNSEKQLTTLSGIVRPEDVSADNIVYSYDIANARINYKGKGSVNTANKAGFLSKLLNFIF